MADKNSYPLSLLLTAVDKVTGPLKKIQTQINEITAPAKKAGNAIASMGEVGGFERLRDAFGPVLSNLRNTAGEVATLSKRVALGFTAAGFAAYELIQPAVEGGAALKFQADRLGMTTDELASYRYAAAKAGIEQTELTDRFDFFNKTLGQAKAGRGALRGLLLGVTGGAQVLQQMLKAKTTGGALDVILERMDELPDKAKRAALAAAAFGRHSLSMENLAELGAKRIADLRKEFLETAGSQLEFADGSVRVVQAEAKLEAAWTGARNTLLVPLFPILTEQLASFTGFLVAHRQDIREWAQDAAVSVGQFARTLPARFQEILGFARRVRTALQPIADIVGGWPTLLIGVAAAILAGPLLGALAQLTASIVTLGVAIGLTPFGWLIAGLAAVGFAAVVLTKKYDDMFDAAKRALNPPHATPLHGPEPYTLEEAQQRLFELNQQPGAETLTPHGALNVDASGLPRGGSSRPSIVPQALSASPQAAAQASHPGLSVDASQLPGDTRDVHASLKIEVAAPKGTKVTTTSSSFDSLMLSVGHSLAESH